MLEIGSSTGAFIEIIATDDIDCHAVELDDANREYSKRFAREVYADISRVPSSTKFN
jgi:hypothetical protein